MFVRTIMWLLVCSHLLGCAAAPVPKPPVPAAPTMATAGGTTVVAVAAPEKPCCPPPSIWDFLGVKQMCQLFGGIGTRILSRLGSRFPGLEPKPALLPISDPANLESPNPAVATAAGVKADEDAAAQKVKAIRYLATIGCGGCYPDIEAALLAALDDCTEEVRWEAAKAFRTAAGSPCEHCKSKSCCGPKVQKRLRAVVEDKDDKGCFVEPSARVRRMARLALAQCGGAVYDELLLVPEEGPSEGPAEEVEEEVVVETAGGPAASNSNKTQLTSQSGTSTRDPIDDAGLNSSVRVRSASMDGAESDGTQNIQATDTQNADTQNSDAQNDAKAQTVSVMKSSTTATRTTPTKANATKTAATKTTSTRTSATKSATKSAAPRAATPATSTAPSQPGTVQIITLPTAPCRDCQTSTTPSRSSNAGFPAMQATGIETANNNVVQLGTEPASATNQVVQAVGADPVVYRSEIAKFYEANQDRFRLPADLRAEVLSTRFDKHASRAEAYQVLFARRIALLKEDQSAAAESAGAIQVLDLGWLGREQFDSVAIAESVFNTPVGGISPMWADENGWHAIRVLERRQPKVRPLAEVADEIYHELVWQKKLASGASHATHLQAAE